MPHSALRPRSVLKLFLCGALLAAAGSFAGKPAVAFGFGRFGGFGHPVMGVPAWRRLPPPRPRGPVVGRYPRPPGLRGWPPHRPPIARGGGGVVGGGIIGGGGAHIVGPSGGGGGGGAGAATAQANPPYVPDEIVTSFAAGTTQQAIEQFAARYSLTPIETQQFALIGVNLYRWRIGGGRSVPSIVQALGSENIVATVQPNYYFALEDAAAKAAPAAGDPAQYVLAQLQIAQAQQLATGKGVLVAVIDSEIDAKHPDLAGAIVKSFDAASGAGAPHAHGTSIAGAIAAHGKLLGIAPAAQILAAHAFDGAPGQANGTSFAIYKSLQWATDSHARIINMSFAGPSDPILARLLAAAFNNGIILIAAAGNAGPQSSPLYPAADPDVIAVTATDDADHVFKMANRGRYIAVAAPGVDVLALAPGDAYQLATGTSIAAAHVSGIAALLLERKPTLTPSDIRGVLIATAKQIAPPSPDADDGAGLVNAYRAVTWLDRKSVAPATAPVGGAEAKQ